MGHVSYLRVGISYGVGSTPCFQFRQRSSFLLYSVVNVLLSCFTWLPVPLSSPISSYQYIADWWITWFVPFWSPEDWRATLTPKLGTVITSLNWVRGNHTICFQVKERAVKNELALETRERHASRMHQFQICTTQSLPRQEMSTPLMVPIARISLGFRERMDLITWSIARGFSEFSGELRSCPRSG